MVSHGGFVIHCLKKKKEIMQVTTNIPYRKFENVTKIL